MTLARRLLFLVGLALLPPLAVQIWTGIELRRGREAALAVQAVAATRDLQADMVRIAEGVRQLLLALSETEEIRDGDTKSCTAYLKRVAEQFQTYALLAANAPDGSILCSNAGVAPGSYSNAARAYHRRAMASGTFAVGDLVTGVTTHERSLHFALPFQRADGSPGGIVLASVGQDALAREIATAALPANALVVVVDPSGTVVAGSLDGRPIMGDWVGQPAAPGLLAVLDSPPGTVTARGPDGMTRLFGIAPPDALLGGMRVAVGLDGAAALSATRTVGLRYTAALVAGAALAAAVGVTWARRFILAPLARLALAADRVGMGQAGARSDLGLRSREIREVGAAFDRMAAALAARERTARESEARFRQMADSAPALIWMTNQDGALVFANLHFSFLFGPGAAESAPEGWTRFPLAEDLPRFRAAFMRAFSVRGPFRAEIRARCHDGTVRWLRCEGVARLDEVGAFLGYTGCAVDVTEARQSTDALEARIAERTADLRREMQERARAETALRQAQKMEAVGQLTGGIAHDFNNMLQGISGALEAVQRRIEQGRAAETGRFVEGARRTVERAAALTGRLLAFARRQALQPATIDPRRLVAGLEELASRTVGPGIHLTVTHVGEGWLVRCDPNQLENALLNLVINARDAMPGGGRITIATAEEVLSAEQASAHEGVVAGEHIAISVSDGGVGMDEATKARAFEPFFTTKPHGQGTGLGLSQIYGFLRQSNGAVRLESTPDEGTTVTMLLPRSTADETEATAVRRPEAADSGGACLLLVEDEAEVRTTTVDYLEACGYRVITAADGAEALAILAQGAEVDGMVTDVGLPGGLNGRQVADAARERRPGLPVLFITGYAAGALDVDLPAGMRLLAKPFETAALGTCIRALLSL